MNLQIEEKIKNAFGNTKYEWRTIRGVADECGITQDVVRSYIAIHGDEIVKSSARNAKGEPLFTSRKEYRSRANLGSRLSSIIRNRGA